MDITQFQLNGSKCIGRGACTKVCCGEILSVDEGDKARIAPVTVFGWAELYYPRGVQRQGCAQLQRPAIPEAVS